MQIHKATFLSNQTAPSSILSPPFSQHTRILPLPTFVWVTAINVRQVPLPLALPPPIHSLQWFLPDSSVPIIYLEWSCFWPTRNLLLASCFPPHSLQNLTMGNISVCLMGAQGMQHPRARCQFSICTTNVKPLVHRKLIFLPYTSDSSWGAEDFSGRLILFPYWIPDWSSAHFLWLWTISYTFSFILDSLLLFT